MPPASRIVSPPPNPHPRQPSSHQLPQPHPHPTSVLLSIPCVATYFGHIVFHLIQVSVFQGPHELLVAHHCSGAGQLAGQKTRRRWRQQADTTGQEGDRTAPSPRGEEKAGEAARRVRQLAAATVGAGESTFAATGPSRAGSAWPRRSRSVYTSGSLPARTLPQLPLPLPLPVLRIPPRGPSGDQPVCAGAVARQRGYWVDGETWGEVGRRVKGVRGLEGRKVSGDGELRAFQMGSGCFCTQ